MATRISVSVKPHAKREQVQQVGPAEYRVSVAAPPHEGKANFALIALLADYFSVPKSTVRIVRGRSNRNKLIEIE